MLELSWPDSSICHISCWERFGNLQFWQIHHGHSDRKSRILNRVPVIQFWLLGCSKACSCKPSPSSHRCNHCSCFSRNLPSVAQIDRKLCLILWGEMIQPPQVLRRPSRIRIALGLWLRSPFLGLSSQLELSSRLGGLRICFLLNFSWELPHLLNFHLHCWILQNQSTNFPQYHQKYHRMSPRDQWWVEGLQDGCWQTLPKSCRKTDCDFFSKCVRSAGCVLWSLHLFGWRETSYTSLSFLQSWCHVFISKPCILNGGVHVWLFWSRWQSRLMLSGEFWAFYCHYLIIILLWIIACHFYSHQHDSYLTNNAFFSLSQLVAV